MTIIGPRQAGPESFQGEFGPVGFVTCEHANMRSLISTPRELSSHPVDVGQTTEAIILSELVKRGHNVLVPFGTNHR
jgi:hypothetical protein